MQNQHFFYRTGRYLQQIVLDEIAYLESKDNYTKFYTVENTNFMVRATLETCMNLLPKNTFLRVHRSYAAAGQYIALIKRDGVILPVIKTELPVSKQFYPSLKRQIVILQNKASKARKKQE